MENEGNMRISQARLIGSLFLTNGRTIISYLVKESKREHISFCQSWDEISVCFVLIKTKTPKLRDDPVCLVVLINFRHC